MFSQRSKFSYGFFYTFKFDSRAWVIWPQHTITIQDERIVSFKNARDVFRC